jgi:hypothetical protein
MSTILHISSLNRCVEIWGLWCARVRASTPKVVGKFSNFNFYFICQICPLHEGHIELVSSFSKTAHSLECITYKAPRILFETCDEVNI